MTPLPLSQSINICLIVERQYQFTPSRLV